MSVLSSNLIRAEEEIYRLDDIVDRFCTVSLEQTPSFEDAINFLGPVASKVCHLNKHFLYNIYLYFATFSM